MATPFPLDTSWVGGMQRDYPRDSMPGEAAWNLVDWIPAELNAPLRKRGGFQYVGNTMSGVTSMTGIASAPFSAGTQVVGIDQAGKVWNILAATTPGTAVVPEQNPVFYRNKLIIPAANGTSAPQAYDGSTVAALGVTAPAGLYADVYKDHLMLGRNTANPTRLFFSNPADPTTWDTTLQVWDTSDTLTGIASVRNAILCFHGDTTERIRGSIPPPGGDFTMDTFLHVGCLDAQSIVKWNDQVIFAGSSGVYMTDGASNVDLTRSGGMVNYWHDNIMPSYATTWHLVAGLYRNHYCLAILDNSNVMQDFLICNLLTRNWYRFSNFAGTAMGWVTSPAEELYVGIGARVAKMSSCWSPAAANKLDANGTAVLPILETPIRRGFQRFHRRWVQSEGFQTWKAFYVNYDLRDAATDNPQLQFAYVTTPEATSYTTVGTVPETTTQARVRLGFGGPYRGIGLKITQTQPSSETKLYMTEAEYAPRSLGRI